ncbi:MAG: HAEPLYID family protein [Bacteroidota bacterium]
MYLISLLCLSLDYFSPVITPTDSTDEIRAKVLHAEPLYIDLIRDLGARKGEKEWNIGMGMTDRLSYDSYEFLVEYEWAPINRLGLEIEVPVTIFTGISGESLIANGQIDANGPAIGKKPSDRIESLKMAAQYTFLVAEELQTSLAIGGITELEFTDLNKISRRSIFQGILYNPFFIAAKRWPNNFHTLLYTGPRITTHFGTSHLDIGYEINSNFHYMIPGTRNFVGLEINKRIENNDFEMVMRPQMRLVINNSLMVGIVPGIPISKERERLSAFVRLIYEPRHRNRAH